MNKSVKQSSKTIWLVSAIAALAGLLFGFDTGIISGALIFIQKSFTLTTGMKEMIVSSVLLGAMLGSLTSGHLTDKYGRRGIMLVIATLFIIGTLIAVFASNIQMIMIGRIFIGIAIGMGSYTAPLYIAEAAPFEKRGALVSLNQLAITIGILCSYSINYTFINTHGSWRWMFAIGILPAILLGLGMLLLPESPRWLVKEGQLDKAKHILQYLRGSQQQVEEEISAIKNSLDVRQAKLKEIFAPWVRRVLWLGIFLGFLQQVSGINTIIYYAPTIFEMAGFRDISSTILATVGIGIVNVLSTIFAICYLDKLGRRSLMFIGLIGMTVSLLCLSIAFHFASSDYLRWVSVISIFVYIICFAFSLGALLWLMVAEIFPLEIRGAAMGVAVFSCWFWNFVVSATFLTLLNALGASKTFLVYAAMCIVGLIVGYFYLPETKGVSLETIEENIRSGLPLREIGASVNSDR